MSNRTPVMLVFAVMSWVVCSAVSLGQSSAPASDPQAPPAPAASASEKKPKRPVANLDELLGLPSSKRQPARPEGEAGLDEAVKPGPEGELDQARGELERKLTDQEIAEKFRDAVRQMGESAERIAKANDVGLVTQRLQEEIILKLDLLVKQAENASSSSSSSSSSQQQQQQGQRDPKRQQGKQGQQQQAQSQAGAGENKGEAMPPPGEDPRFAGRLDTSRAAWGNLPERVRQSLLQGSSDQFSSLYEALTEAYYKKLAEEGSDQ